MPADAGGALANGDLAMSHCSTATACNFPFLGPAIFGSSNYEVSCESPVSHFTPGGNQANCINVLGRRDSCSPVFYRLWPFFLLPRVMCSPFLLCNCHAGSEQWPDSLGLLLPPATCHLLGRNRCFKGLGGIPKGSQRLLLICSSSPRRQGLDEKIASNG